MFAAVVVSAAGCGDDSEPSDDEGRGGRSGAAGTGAVASGGSGGSGGRHDGGGNGGSAADGGREDADPALNDAGCPGEEVPVYVTPGCNAQPVCAGPAFDACLGYVCGCDGTNVGGCGYYSKPFQHFGPCADASSDAAEAILEP